jgi:hypothetical protein
MYFIILGNNNSLCTFIYQYYAIMLLIIIIYVFHQNIIKFLLNKNENVSISNLKGKIMTHNFMLSM